MCAVPLAQMNLRAVFWGDVTASDASEWGGGFCDSWSDYDGSACSALPGTTRAYRRWKTIYRC